MSSEFERIGSETLFDGKFIAVRRDTFRHQDGEVVHRELVTHPGAVAVLMNAIVMSNASRAFAGVR